MEVRAITRKWGNSIAVVIPAEIVEKQKIKEDEEIIIKVEKKRPKAGVLFGKFTRKSGKTAQQIKDEVRKGWESASDREERERWKR